MHDSRLPSNDQLRSALISLEAIRHNLAVLSAHVESGTKILADVRADAYGHGAVAVALAAARAGVSWLGVSTIAEGIALRRAGIETSILSMRPAGHEDFREAAAHNITPAISSIAQLSQTVDSGLPGIHLDVSVDESLSGTVSVLAAAESLVAAAAIAHGSSQTKVSGLMGSPPSLPLIEAADPFIAARRALAIAGIVPDVVHRSTSASIVAGIPPEGTLIRLGRGLYGLSPLAGRDAQEFGLLPAMTVTVRVIATKTVGAGEGVSYGYLYRTTKKSNLALCALGYADGIDRHACGGAVVWHNGSFYPIAGRVAMDAFMLDMGDTVVSEGDVVTLFGDPAFGPQSPDAWAQSLGKNGSEVVAAIGPRVPRSYQ